MKKLIIKIYLRSWKFSILFISVSRVVDGVVLNIEEDGEIRAIFPSSSSIKVAANNSILRFSFSADRATLFNMSKGLLGKL